METPKSVIFGLKNFWEGIDVPGPKLKLIIIPKLPFPTPNDPLFKSQQLALNKLRGNAMAGFNEIAVPRMITEMRQGIGRLIRSATDCGFVAVLDTRINTGTSNEETHNKKITALQKYPDNYTRTGYAKRLFTALDLPNYTHDFKDVAVWAKRWFNLDLNGR
jgi:Rad3-related DNA helicase